MDKFWTDFEIGEIHLRDKWQFELKSEFAPIPHQAHNTFSQEFYIFIPNALQINDQTYSKASFYEDQTNLIRFKTPEFTFDELIDPVNQDSPLHKLHNLSNTPENRPIFERESKLFANIFRSTLRNDVHELMIQFAKEESLEHLTLCKEKAFTLINKMLNTVNLFEKETFLLRTTWTDLEASKLVGYVRDFISISINYSCSALLEEIRSHWHAIFQEIDTRLCQILKAEKLYREAQWLEPTELHPGSLSNEAILYQSGLLNKFFMDVLLLQTSRSAIDQKYRNLIGGIAAAIAMLFYILLLLWQGSIFLINSEPFILFSVVLYVLKDRLKEEIKAISFKQAFRWFCDFKTEILSPTSHTAIGELKESFSFIDEASVPKEIARVRSREFHTYLETIKRPERVIYYKKTINIFQNPAKTIPDRLTALNILFRLDIHRFLAKASDPTEPHITLDTETLELSRAFLPKIYHVNIILKNQLFRDDGSLHITLQKFRLILDKDGIKRVEKVELPQYDDDDIPVT